MATINRSPFDPIPINVAFTLDHWYRNDAIKLEQEGGKVSNALLNPNPILLFIYHVSTLSAHTRSSYTSLHAVSWYLRFSFHWIRIEDGSRIRKGRRIIVWIDVITNRRSKIKSSNFISAWMRSFEIWKIYIIRAIRNDFSFFVASLSCRSNEIELNEKWIIL